VPDGFVAAAFGSRSIAMMVDGWGEHARQIPKHRAHDVTDSDARQ
jgi:hypothetical protein